jgi:cytoskeletal protein RodZ
MESLGQQLKREREKKGLSLKEISHQTKIGLRYLEAIENDQLDHLPGGFFTRQILRAYLINIGQEPSSWLTKYQQAGLLPVEARNSKLSKPEKPARAKINNLAWVIITVIVMALFVGLIYLSIKTSRKAMEARPVPRVESTATTSKKEPQIEVQAEKEKPALPAPQYEGLNLELTFNEDCWIQVYADGNLVLDGLKLEGFKTSVKAKSELIINLGNAGGVSFVLNGKVGKPLGKRGAVVKNIKITKDNLDQFVNPENPA